MGVLEIWKHVDNSVYLVYNRYNYISLGYKNMGSSDEWDEYISHYKVNSVANNKWVNWYYEKEIDAVKSFKG